MPRAAALLGLLAVGALAACRAEPDAPSTASARPALAASASEPTASMACGASGLERSACMIELLLADVRATYTAPGGISRIVAGSSTSYTVALPQEERVDLLTYEFAVSGDTVSITGKREATESMP